jgi:DNA-binding transcriptional LysR family regulator
LVYVAGSEYVKQYGLPKNPEDLKQHKCLAINIKDKKNWTFYHDQAEVRQPVDLAFETNSFDALYKATRDNMGIAQLPQNLIQEDIAAEKMVTVFPEHKSETLDTYAYYTANKSASKKVSLFLDEIMQNTAA